MEFDDITYSLFFGGGHKKVNVISPPFQEKENLHGAVRGSLTLCRRYSQGAPVNSNATKTETTQFENGRGSKTLVK